MMNGITTKELFLFGGPVMIPIVFCSILALTLIIKKWRYFKVIKTDVNNFKSTVFSLVRENKIKPAIALCETSPLPVARVFKAGLLKFGCPREEVKDAIETAVCFEIPQFEKGLLLLITIANVSPLFGVLGTVLGMTNIFQTIENQSAAMSTITAANLAGGIWQALLTTLAGLIVAIPSFVAYNYFIDLVNNAINDLYSTSNQLVNLLTHVNESLNSQPKDIVE